MRFCLGVDVTVDSRKIMSLDCVKDCKSLSVNQIDTVTHRRNRYLAVKDLSVSGGASM